MSLEMIYCCAIAAMTVLGILDGIGRDGKEEYGTSIVGRKSRNATSTPSRPVSRLERPRSRSRLRPFALPSVSIDFSSIERHAVMLDRFLGWPAGTGGSFRHCRTMQPVSKNSAACIASCSRKNEKNFAVETTARNANICRIAHRLSAMQRKSTTDDETH